MEKTRPSASKLSGNDAEKYKNKTSKTSSKKSTMLNKYGLSSYYIEIDHRSFFVYSHKKLFLVTMFYLCIREKAAITI